MKSLVIYGAGGFAREVLWLVEEINKKTPEWDILGFIDDDRENFGKVLNGKAVLGGRDFLNTLSPEVYIVIAIGNGEIREKIISELGKKNYATLIHPSVVISETTSIGEGSIINRGNVLTTNITTGKHVNIHYGCTVGHDVVLKNFVSVFPGVNISGGVEIQESSTIGAGSVVIQYSIIGTHTIIGSLSNVICDISSFSTAVGNPAKVIKNRGDSHV